MEPCWCRQTWMVLQRSLPIGTLDLVCSRILFQIQDLIRVDGWRLAVDRIFPVRHFVDMMPAVEMQAEVLGPKLSGERVLTRLTGFGGASS